MNLKVPVAILSIEGMFWTKTVLGIFPSEN